MLSIYPRVLTVENMIDGHCWHPDLFPREIALGKHVLQVFLLETDPMLSFFGKPKCVSLVFPEETAGKHVSNTSFPQKDHLLPAVG
jgi:hypothetical protein